MILAVLEGLILSFVLLTIILYPLLAAIIAGIVTLIM